MLTPIGVNLTPWTRLTPSQKSLLRTPSLTPLYPLTPLSVGAAEGSDQSYPLSRLDPSSPPLLSARVSVCALKPL